MIILSPVKTMESGSAFIHEENDLNPQIKIEKTADIQRNMSIDF